MKKTDLTNAKKYFDSIKNEKYRQRNVTSSSSWIWHDQDELLKHSNEGYFEKYHERSFDLEGIFLFILFMKIFAVTFIFSK